MPALAPFWGAHAGLLYPLSDNAESAYQISLDVIEMLRQLQSERDRDCTNVGRSMTVLQLAESRQEYPLTAEQFGAGQAHWLQDL